MSEEKPNIPPLSTKENDDLEPSFRLTMKYQIGANSPLVLEASKTQKRVLNDILPVKKEAYALPDWWMQNRDRDHLLFLMCGVLHPAEHEMLRHYIDRWHDFVFDEKKKDIMNDDDIPNGSHVSIYMPRASVRNFLADHAEFMMDHHENLLLRLSATKPMIEELDTALYFEGVRREPKQWVSAMDELVGQNLYEGQATFPSTEDRGWLWMNKMVATQKQGLWKMDLSTTREMLGNLNRFRIYKGFASLLDYANQPVATQRVNGKLQKTRLPWMSSKIMTTIGVLIGRGFLNRDIFGEVSKMTPKERDDFELTYKRTAASAFLADLSKTAPDNEMRRTLVGGFKAYFQPLLQKMGHSVLEQQSPIEYKNSKGELKHNGVVEVSFYDSAEQAVAAAKLKKVKKPNSNESQKQTPPMRPDSGMSK